MTQLSRKMDTFDILFKNFFNHDSFFAPIIETKIGHPVDIFENETGLQFDIACTGLSKEDIDISIENDILKISYNKIPEAVSTDHSTRYIVRGIAKRAFNLGYRVSSKFNLASSSAEMKNGLLRISVPFAKEETVSKKTLTIN